VILEALFSRLLLQALKQPKMSYRILGLSSLLVHKALILIPVKCWDLRNSAAALFHGTGRSVLNQCSTKAGMAYGWLEVQLQSLFTFSPRWSRVVCFKFRRFCFRTAACSGPRTIGNI